MRISGWFLGVVGFVGLMLMTALCSVVAYGATRSFVIDLWDSGSKVSSLGELPQAILNPQGFRGTPTVTPSGSTALLLASPTPQITATTAPTTDAAVTAVPTTAADNLVTDATVAPTAAPIVAEPTVPVLTDPRQIRILVLGIDQRKGYEQEKFFRSDTMILVSIDPVRKRVGVVSFPRDLWVTIPDIGQERINTAMREGDRIAYPGGGGPRLAMETVAFNFGVRVDRYIVVNFNLFESVVNTLTPNGVEVCVKEAIHDPKYPDVGFGFLDVRFDPGCQRLDATRLLQYARTRATQGGDFDRGRRQQEVLEAVRNELVSAGGITNALTQIPTLWNELADNYRTNLTMEEIIQLAYLMTEIPRENIQYAVIDASYGEFATINNDQVIIPYPAEIVALLENVIYGRGGSSTIPTTNTTTTTTANIGDLRTAAQAENPPIYVYNGTTISGLAGKTREWLIGKGVVITDVGNMPSPANGSTEIRVYGGQGQATAQYLAALLNVPVERIKIGSDAVIASGVLVVAGSDIEPLLGGQ